jgi:hypothetical protein
MFGFIAPYTFTVRDYREYSAIAILHILQFTVAHTLRFSVFTSRTLATDLSVPLSLQITHEVFFSKPNSFLAIILQLPIPKTRLYHFRLLFYTSQATFFVPLNPSALTPRKTPSSIVKDACLLVRYLAMDVLLLSRASVLRESAYRPVA